MRNFCSSQAFSKREAHDPSLETELLELDDESDRCDFLPFFFFLRFRLLLPGDAHDHRREAIHE